MGIHYLEPWTDAFDSTKQEVKGDQLTLNPVAAVEIKTPPIVMGEAIGVELRSQVIGEALGGANDIDMRLFSSPAVELKTDTATNPRPRVAAEYNSTEPLETVKTFDMGLATALGTDAVTNGAFATDTGWTKGDGWSIAGGKAVKTTGNVPGSIQQALVEDASAAFKDYLFRYDMSAQTSLDFRAWFELSANPGGQLFHEILRQQSNVLGLTLVHIVRLTAGMVTGALHLDALDRLAVTIDNVKLEEIVNGGYLHTVSRRLDQLASGFVIGYLPAADLSSTTWIRAAYRRWTYYVQ